MTQHKNIVFGLGTGRCGTKSLASLLNQQADAYVTHERYRWRLGWEHSESQVDSILNLEPAKSETNFELYGDVAFSWLPYVELIIRWHPQAKFICLKRNKKDTVNSWIAKAPYDNHWQKHDGTKYRFGHWSRCFPKFALCFTRRQAIEQYWEYYYAQATEYQHKYPENFQIFNISSLNSFKGQVKLLCFAGIDKKKQIHNIKINENPSSIVKHTGKYLDS